MTPEIIERLGIRPVTFEVGHDIEQPGTPIRRLYFVEEGMASVTNTFADGTQVEVGMFGYESVIGVSALMGAKRTLYRVFTQIAGHGYSCHVDAARAEFHRGELFHDLTLRYVQAQLLTAMQSTGCNVHHSVDERLARWLLLCADRANQTTFGMSQEFLSFMLGNSRPTVSAAAALLKNLRLIEYTRGVIHILDVEGLQRKACECYRVIKDHLDNYAEFDRGIPPG